MKKRKPRLLIPSLISFILMGGIVYFLPPDRIIVIALLLFFNFLAWFFLISFVTTSALRATVYSGVLTTLLASRALGYRTILYPIAFAVTAVALELILYGLKNKQEKSPLPPQQP